MLSPLPLSLPVILKVMGDVKIFGSFSDGFKPGTSNLEVALLTKSSGEQTVSLLKKLAQRAQKLCEDLACIPSAFIPPAFMDGSGRCQEIRVRFK